MSAKYQVSYLNPLAKVLHDIFGYFSQNFEDVALNLAFELSNGFSKDMYRTECDLLRRPTLIIRLKARRA